MTAASSSSVPARSGWRRLRIGAVVIAAIVFAPIAVAVLIARMKMEGRR